MESVTTRTEVCRPGLLNRMRIVSILLMYPLFALGSVLLLIAYPVVRLRGGQTALRRTAQRLAKIWVAVARSTGALELSVTGEPLTDRVLLVANHPTLIDIVLVQSLLPDVCCILKSDLARVPVLRQLIGPMGWVSNADPEAMLDEAASRLDAGEAVIVFPEGTRTVPGEPISFRLGAAEIANRATCRVQPIVIHYQGDYLSKDVPWYAVPKHALRYRIEVSPALPEDWRAGGRRAARRRLHSRLQEHFEQRLSATKVAEKNSSMG